MIAQAKRDIDAGEVGSLTYKYARDRYRISANDAKRLRSALIESKYLQEVSGNRFVAA